MRTITLKVAQTDDEWNITGEVKVACAHRNQFGAWQPSVEEARLEKWAFDYEYFQEMDDWEVDERAQQALASARDSLMASPEWAELTAEAEANQ